MPVTPLNILSLVPAAPEITDMQPIKKSGQHLFMQPT